MITLGFISNEVTCTIQGSLLDNRTQSEKEVKEKKETLSTEEHVKGKYF